MKQYCSVELIEGPSLGPDVGAKGWHSYVDYAECLALNTRLAEGWELIQAIPHRAQTDDITVIAFLIGLPEKQAKATPEDHKLRG